MKLPTIALAAFVLLASLPPAGARAATQGAADPPTVIRTPTELERYLQTIPVDRSPLSLLPPGARNRFLSTLTWGENGVGGFLWGDLTQYLTGKQIGRVLALFDLEAYAAGVQGRAKPLTGAQRRASETPLESKFDEYYFARADARHGQPGPSPAVLYDHLLAPWQVAGKLAALDDSDLGLLFRAAGGVAFDSPSPGHLDDLQLDLATLHRRGLATTTMVVHVHDQLVAARRFTGANALAAEYPAAGIKPLPRLLQAANVDDGSPTALIMAPDGESMLRQPIDMRVPLRIVVVAGCHFSEDAARAIRADPQLDKLFHEHAVWLAAESESLPDVLEWNRQFPNQPMNVAWRNGEWTMLDSWSIPTFYVFRNAKLVDRWSGWGPDGMQRLQEHLRRNDLPD